MSPLQLCLEISISLNSRNLLQFLQFSYFTKEKGGKPDRKTYPHPYGLRNPYINLKSENSQDYAQKPQRNCTFMNSASGYLRILEACRSENIELTGQRADSQTSAQGS